MKVNACLYCGHEVLTYVTHRSDGVGIVRCERCTVMMVEEINDDTESLYTSDYFQKDSDTKYGYTSYLSAPIANLIGKYAFSRIFAREPGIHLDLGCADGSLIELFEMHGFQSSGLEISKDAVAIARSKGLDVSFSTLESFPKYKQKLTVVTAFDLLEHADKPGNVLRETYANLEDGGCFVFSTLSVRNNDPTDYWFNHSLEHYVYYNQESLTFILGEVFGKGNFGFVEVENNGIAEFWGFAKKGRISQEDKLMKLIRAGDYDRHDSELSYLLSLFYNQVSRFTDSQKVIDAHKDTWSASRYLQAYFYNNYFQGKFERAVADGSERRYLIPAKNAAYWQALTHAEDELGAIRLAQQKNEAANESKSKDETIESLRSQLFHLGEELSELRNSRLVRKAIRARELAGKVRHSRHVHQAMRIRRAPRKARSVGLRAAHKVRVVGAPLIPEKARKSIKRAVKNMRNRIQQRQMQVVVVDNQKWSADLPLVSVVIPYYNRKDTIDDTLKSLEGQTFRSFETIIVNDGSPDEASVKKLEELEKSSIDALIINQKNQGVSAARNRGIQESRGKYVMCLDSDDMIDPTFIEKCVVALETSPDISVVTTYMDIFGVKKETIKHGAYDPRYLYSNNMVITAAMFRKEAWEVSGGYKSGVGYEDWEYWINLSEHGFWGRLIREPLFLYRTAISSRYLDDRTAHWDNLELIRSYHPNYKRTIAKLISRRKHILQQITAANAFINVSDESAYAVQPGNHKERVLIAIPWMTFGGAETLIYNFCSELKQNFAMSFVTGLESENEWEYKFKEITPEVYHLANLFTRPELRLEFISNYIATRGVSILHVIHCGYMFEMLPELKRRHPKLKVIVTLFNDRVPEYFNGAIDSADYIDVYATDNGLVAAHYKELLGDSKTVITIPNGVNCYDVFNPGNFDRYQVRKELGLDEDDLAVFFIGRLSPEKNPDVYVEAAARLLRQSTGEGAPLKFFMIGDGPMREQIEGAVRAVGSGDLQYLGYKQTDEVARCLAACDIFVLPSAIEGFPLSILEAMSMNAVPVASKVGGVPDVVMDGQTGYIISPPGSVDAIVETLGLLRKDSKKVQKLKLAARAEIEANYSNKVLGQRYTQMYKEVIK